MTAIQTRNRLVRYLTNEAVGREPLRVFLDFISENLADSAIFGGMIRDFGLGYAREFQSDIDIVTMSSSAEIYRLISKYNPVRNKFGGFRFSASGRLFDIWSFYDTWAIREGHIDGEVLDDLCKTTFFSLDAAIFRLKKKSLTTAKNYERIISERVLAINLMSHPNPERIALRAIQMAISKDLFVAPDLCEFIVRNVRGYGDDSGVRGFVEGVRHHLRYSPDRNFKYGVQLNIWPYIDNAQTGRSDKLAMIGRLGLDEKSRGGAMKRVQIVKTAQTDATRSCTSVESPRFINGDEPLERPAHVCVIGERLELHDRDVCQLLDRVNESTKEANASLDDALSFIAESNKRIEAMSENLSDTNKPRHQE